MAIRPGAAALGAGACVAMLLVVGFVSFHVAAFSHANESIHLQFGDLDAHGRLEWIARHLVSPFDPNPYVHLALVPVAFAVVRGRPRSAHRSRSPSAIR
jgi:hypothetical protein